MRNTIIYLMFGAIFIASFGIKQLQLNAAEANAALWKAKVEQLHKDVAIFKATNDRANTAMRALLVQAQACMDRETAARADAERWQQILENMTLRSMSEEEKSGVPDDATRRALLDALDRPL